MELFLVLFILACGVLMVQISASGKYAEYEEKLDAYQDWVIDLTVECDRLRELNNHLYSENTRLERETHK